MLYCVSDIHGEIDRFHSMLKKIQFSTDDTLYIIGDVIDRYPGGVEILKEIMDIPNIVMLLGNHEQMCLDTLGPNNTFGSRELWKQNGGNCTYQELLYICSPAERRRIIEFLMTLPDHLDIEVSGRKFHLVHGFPSNNPNVRLWSRPDPNAPAPFHDRTTIIGHTPTCYLNNKTNEPFIIWHGNGIIDIDCGCGSQTEHRRLGCLCLNDMKEFYA